ncbi:helix-turn-helix domain-containing protein [Tenacibaculum maritimum]|uniref:helix-turn-helix domain-containing protein n=1 Tax=Tenacibaculum maritimum TaxID=107401 RepID=UPI0012E65778|nr:helix-turn-helix transcriptional regulator [Tenacibaculum maritimum]MDB0600853.1 helix-turn-helix transcriptional regulator [Tenacibaculum maritimum]MDB0612025.1 helix-turn-helix transcriptional regulator [Tenacibaculum maritimum]CAA0203474.1 putative transcriptional regulator, HTH-XRE family [Tenacibaculum maritimum]
MNIFDQAVANVIRKFREGKGFSQEELAWKAELHRTYISQLERGLKSVTMKTLFKISTELEVEFDIFTKEIINEFEKLSA